MSRILIHALAAGALVLAAALPAIAEQASDGHDTHHDAAAAPSATLTAGEVRKIDKMAKKITIRHGPIVNVEMPAMTMVFPVTDPAMLDRVRVGDRILFAAERTGDTITVTRIEKFR